MRSAFRLSFLFVSPWLALQGCGGVSTSTLSSGDVDPVATLTFATWCESWGLTCPTTPPDPVPGPDNQWTAEQWKSALAVAKAAADSPGDVRVLRAELDDANLAAALARLGGADALAMLKERLDASHFASLRLTAGGLQLANTEASDYATGSKLVVHSETAVAAQVSAAFDMGFTGLTLKGSTDATDTMSGVAFTAPNVLDWRGQDNLVTGVPIKFLLQEVIGLDATDLPGMTMPPYADLVPAINPLKDWLTTGTRDIDLNRATFSQLALHMPRLVSDPAMSRALGYILGKLNVVKSTAATRRTKFVTGEASQEIRCNANDQATLMISPSFGVTSVTRLGTDSVTIQLYGIKAKPLTGAIRPTITLGRIDLEPTRIVIHNVPVVGQYVIDMTGGGGGSMSLACGT